MLKLPHIPKSKFPRKNVKFLLGKRTLHAKKLEFKGLPFLNSDFKAHTQDSLMRRLRVIYKKSGHNTCLDHEHFDRLSRSEENRLAEAQTNDTYGFNHKVDKGDKVNKLDKFDKTDKIDILVNCTGIGFSYPVNSYYNRKINSSLSIKAFDYVINSHITDCYENIVSHVDQMAENGSIVNLTSYGAYDGWVGEAAFTGGCAGICALTENFDSDLSRQLREKNIRLNAIAYNWLHNKKHIYREAHHFFHREISRVSQAGFLNVLTPENVIDLNIGEPFYDNPFLLRNTDLALADMISEISLNKDIDRTVITAGSINRMSL